MNDRILLAGTHSGCGKTTVTLALLAAFKQRGLAVSAFKCGPDYIDPMFHRETLGLPSHNLDPFFSTGDQLCAQLLQNVGDISVIEGVMGYYDGVSSEGAFSTFDVADKTDTPVILVVNCKGQYTSAGAVLRGFRTFREESHIRGVIFNHASPMLYPGLAEIAQKENLTPLGFLPRDESVTVGSRHLGLLTAAELPDIHVKLDRLATLSEQYIDIDGVLTLARSASAIHASVKPCAPVGHARIAVARDAAFCFLYQENLELLTQLGADLVYFSPLTDTALPKDIQGLYLPGGYPELHLEQLSANRVMRESIQTAVTSGLPTVAECGGFLYLHDTLDGFPMAGVIHANAQKTEHLQRFGYVTLTAKRDNLLCYAGDSIRAHSFHYYDTTDNGNGFTAEKPLSARRWDCIHATETMYAGFPHLYFPANVRFAEFFIRKAISYAANRT